MGAIDSADPGCTQRRDGLELDTWGSSFSPKRIELAWKTPGDGGKACSVKDVWTLQ